MSQLRGLSLVRTVPLKSNSMPKLGLTSKNMTKIFSICREFGKVTLFRNSEQMTNSVQHISTKIMSRVWAFLTPTPITSFSKEKSLKSH